MSDTDSEIAEMLSAAILLILMVLLAFSALKPASSENDALYNDSNRSTNKTTKDVFVRRLAAYRLAIYCGMMLGLTAAIVERPSVRVSEWQTLAALSLFKYWLRCGAWALITLRMVIQSFEPGSGLRYANYSAIAVLLSTSLIPLSSSTVESGFDRLSSLQLNLLSLQLFSTITIVIGFVSIPQQQDKLFRGRLVDQQNTVSLLQKFTFAWAGKLLHIAKDKTLHLSDLPVLDHNARSRTLSSSFRWSTDSQKLWWCLIFTHAKPLILQLSLTLFKSALAFASPYIIYRFLQGLEARRIESITDWESGLWVMGLGSSLLLEVLVDNWLQWMTSSQLELPVRGLLSSMVFEKMLQLPDSHDPPKPAPGKEKADSDGQPPLRQSIINHMKLDSNRVTMFCLYNSHFPLALCQLIIASTFLINLIGWRSLLAGLLASFAIIPFTTKLSKKTGSMQFGLAKYRDLKTSLLSEALQSIRQIRFSALERVWEEKILHLREQELDHFWKGHITMFFLVLFVNLGPVLLAAVSLSVFAMQNGQLTPSVAFTALGLFEQLRDALGVLPLIGTYLWEAWISCTRLDDFFSQPGRVNYLSSADEISFDRASIKWPSNKDQKERSNGFCLNSVNLKFPGGELSIITGKTGSGKSLLLASILGEANILAGHVNAPIYSSAERHPQTKAVEKSWIIPHSTAFVSQSPWIENTSVKENILFGLPLELSRYNQTISSCALVQDLELLHNGDETEVGPKGVSLSGGQRWRIALARALYSRAETLVLDDVLSAVDMGVGNWIIEHALSGKLCRGRTRILATHHTASCLSKAKYLVVLAEGTVASAQVVDGGKECREMENVLTADSKNENIKSSMPDRQRPETRFNDSILKVNYEKKETTVKLDKKSARSNKWKVYKTYLQATGGWKFWIIAISTLLSYQLLTASGTWLLKEWANSYTTNTLSPTISSGSVIFFVTAYTLISMVTCVASAVQAIVLYIGGLNASRTMYGKMTHAVLRAPLRWIDTVPAGHILNRFISDFSTIDQRLALDLGFLVEFVFRFLIIVASSLCVSSYMLIFALALLSVYVYIARQYMPGARDLRKLNASSNEPILDQFSSVLSGITTIRAFRRTQFYMDKMHDLIDDNLRSSWYLALCTRWMDLRLGVLGTMFVTAVGIVVLRTGDVDAAMAGFALTFALQYTKAVTGLVRKVAATQSGMDAAERVIEYMDLPIETESGDAAPASWPSEGRIEVQNLVATYDESLPPVLKDLTFFIAPRQTVGIVGRTGAGKSSLASALFRFIEPVGGNIHIDGLDISKLRLHDLRSRLCLIPQDPFLFSGTLRDNLDIHGSKTDDEIRAALIHVQLTPIKSSYAVAKEFPTSFQSQANIFENLSSPISDGGMNLSQGQRQLICLARAILMKPKILVLDEATSAIDMATDTAIQQTLQKEFSNSTRIVIAHRLSTVATFDKILVLDQGKIIEFGSPAELLSSCGLFWDMIRQSSEREQLEAIILKQ